jgi:polyferredoxin
MKIKRKTTGLCQRWRRPVQIATLALFLALFVAGRMPDWSLPTNLFIRLDPLAGLSSGLAGRTIPVRFAPALILVVTTLLLGRVWCGWLCPLGTVLDLVGGPLGVRSDSRSKRWHRVRFLILFALLGAALLANQSLLVLDPLTLLTRALGGIPMLGRWSLAAGRTLAHGFTLPVAPILYLPALLTLAFLAVVLALNRAGIRFWCQVLCPLGALLGLIARVGWLRRQVGEGCSECGLCTRECPMAAPDPDRGFASDPAQCMACLTCQARCPQDAVTFEGRWGWSGWEGYDPTRRQVLASLIAGGVGVWLLRSSPVGRQRSPRPIRPPGAREADLLSRCVRCGECVKVCPSAGLQPITLEAGWEGVWTPALIPRLGWCSYDCCRCGQACPTGAIPRLMLEDKRRAVIGIAWIDTDRCIPWTHLRVCTVCHDTCPLPEKAIVLEKMEAADELGQRLIIRRPRVVEELCIGCGVCEYNCPVHGPAAVRICASPT